MRYRPFSAAAALILAQTAPLPAAAQQTNAPDAQTVHVDTSTCQTVANLSLVRRGDEAPQIDWNCINRSAVALASTGVSAVISGSSVEGAVRQVQAAVPNGDDGACLAMRLLLTPVQSAAGPRIPYTEILYAYVPKQQLMDDAARQVPTQVNFVRSIAELPAQAAACSANLQAAVEGLTPIAGATVRGPLPPAQPPRRAAPQVTSQEI